MTYKQIEASRELRLWIGQVIVPTVSVMAVVLANPDVRKVASEKAGQHQAEIPIQKDQGRVTATLSFIFSALR